MTTNELALVNRINELERRLKRAHHRTHLQRKRARLWRQRALEKVR